MYHLEILPSTTFGHMASGGPFFCSAAFELELQLLGVEVVAALVELGDPRGRVVELLLELREVDFPLLRDRRPLSTSSLA